MKSAIKDVVIIGGGVMGLLSAYELRKQNLSVVIVDAGRIGGAQAASSGITRSIRNDYADPTMAKMANDAYNGWQQLQTDWCTRLIDSCGCLNIFSGALADISKDVSYAANSVTWLARDKRKFQVLDSMNEVRSKWPQLAADFAVLDIEAGMALPRKVMGKLLELLNADQGVEILEDTKVVSITAAKDLISISCEGREIVARKLIVTAGLGTTGVCKKITSLTTAIPITPDRPFELKYFFTDDNQYNSQNLPVLAFLDIGIYAHPVVDSITKGLKVGYYSPPGIELTVDDSLEFIDKFVTKCLPGLSKISKGQVITDVDQCSYDMTPDNKFILGYLGNNANIIVAAGFNGTGYKFAPVISSIISQLAQEQTPIYDISEFDPNRFVNQEGEK